MKAFEIVWSGLPDSRSIYAAETPGKAKYLAAETLLECCYVDSVIEAFRQLSCRRRRDLDGWASQFRVARGMDQEFVCCDVFGGNANG